MHYVHKVSFTKQLATIYWRWWVGNTAHSFLVMCFLVVTTNQTASKYDGPPWSQVNFTLFRAVLPRLRITSNRVEYTLRAPCISALAAFTSSPLIRVHMHFTSMNRECTTQPVAVLTALKVPAKREIRLHSVPIGDLFGRTKIRDIYIVQRE